MHDGQSVPVCLLLYLYFIIVSLDASGAIHATKEKPHNLSPGCGWTRQIPVSKMIPRSISSIIQALCNNGCIWCYVKNPSSTDSSACSDPALSAWQHVLSNVEDSSYRRRIEVKTTTH